MIARELVSIVDPTPGVTRDRVAVITDLEAPDGRGPRKPVEIMDTGGFGVYTAEGKRFDEIGNDLARLTPEIESQIAQAVAGADLILLAIDCQAGLTAQDELFATMLREGRIGSRRRGELGALARVQVVATKVDDNRWEPHAHELSALGFGVPWMCSSTTNYMRRDLMERLYGALPSPAPEDDRVVRADLRIAIIGKRNAGKSSLVNALAGEERVIVSEIPGTTRDAVDVRIDREGKSIVLIDTAGLRRKKSFQDQIEWYAFDRAKRAIARADVVWHIIDATEKVSQVDEQLGQLVNASFKPCVVVVNKWDLAEGRAGPSGHEVSTEQYADYIAKELGGLAWAPVAFSSAITGLNLPGLLDISFDLHAQASTRVSTGKINRLLRKIITTRAPSDKIGSHAKVYYVAQVATNPPTIALVVNRPELFTVNYRRFLVNRLREEMPYGEVPIKLLVRARKAADPDERPGRMVETAAYDPAAALSETLPEGMSDADLLASMPDDPEAYFEEA